MVFSRRMAALSAVVLIPLGIAATSYAQQVELDHGSPTPTSTLDPSPTATPSGATPGDEVVSRPPVTDSPASDDDDDDRGPGTGDDGADDNGPGSDD